MGLVGEPTPHQNASQYVGLCPFILQKSGPDGRGTACQRSHRSVLQRWGGARVSGISFQCLVGAVSDSGPCGHILTASLYHNRGPQRPQLRKISCRRSWLSPKLGHDPKLPTQLTSISAKNQRSPVEKSLTCLPLLTLAASDLRGQVSLAFQGPNIWELEP